MSYGYGEIAYRIGRPVKIKYDLAIFWVQQSVARRDIKVQFKDKENQQA